VSAMVPKLVPTASATNGFDVAVTNGTKANRRKG